MQALRKPTDRCSRPPPPPPPPADQCVVMLSQDSFYRNLSQEELKDVKSEWGPPQIDRRDMCS